MVKFVSLTSVGLLVARPHVLIVGDELSPFSFFPGKIIDKRTPEQNTF